MKVRSSLSISLSGPWPLRSLCHGRLWEFQSSNSPQSRTICEGAGAHALCSGGRGCQGPQPRQDEQRYVQFVQYRIVLYEWSVTQRAGVSYASVVHVGRRVPWRAFSESCNMLIMIHGLAMFPDFAGLGGWSYKLRWLQAHDIHLCCSTSRPLLMFADWWSL